MKLKFLFILALILPATIYCQHVELYVGTYTDGTGSEGIYRYSFDLSNGEAHLVSTVKTPNPSFLAKYQHRLFAVNEMGDGRGTLSLFDISGNGVLFLDSLNTNGDHPCHIVLDGTGEHAFVSNYSGGSLATFGLIDNKSKLALLDVIQYTGSGSNKDRQNSPHIHSAFFDNEGLLYVSDLGTDKIYVYSIKNGNDPGVKLIEENIVFTINGGGPRHLAFDQAGNTLYTLQELTGQLAVFQKAEGEWSLRQLLPIHGDGFEGEHGAADVKISPDGRYVYATNRGDADAVVLYEVLPTGLLEWKDIYHVKGSGPRNFNISPDGKYLLVANQKSNEVVIFDRNQETGELYDNGKRIAVPAPVCLVF